MKHFYFILIGLLCLTVGIDATPSQEHSVVVILEASEGKEEQLKEALITVAEWSRQEEGCLEYRVVQNGASPHSFALYERWSSAEVHQKQFSKPYILEFAAQAESLLAQPFHGVFGHELVAE